MKCNSHKFKRCSLLFAFLQLRRHENPEASLPRTLGGQTPEGYASVSLRNADTWGLAGMRARTLDCVIPGLVLHQLRVDIKSRAIDDAEHAQPPMQLVILLDVLHQR